jgi:hypothetical protein
MPDIWPLQFGVPSRLCLLLAFSLATRGDKPLFLIPPEPRGTSASSALMMMDGRVIIVRGNPRRTLREKKLALCHSDHKKSHMDSPDIEPAKKPDTNRLNSGVALVCRYPAVPFRIPGLFNVAVVRSRTKATDCSVQRHEWERFWKEVGKR